MILAENPLRTINKTPAQRKVIWRQLTPKQTEILLGIISNMMCLSTTILISNPAVKSCALKYLLSAIHHGLLQYPDTCDPKVVEWNGVSQFCINSHIPLLIASLFMALSKFNSKEWNKTHTEVMYGFQNAIDQEKKKGRGGCNSNPLTGSTIEKTGGVDKDGKFVWELSLSLSLG